MGIKLHKTEMFRTGDGEYYGDFHEALAAERRHALETMLETIAQLPGNDYHIWHESIGIMAEILVHNAEEVATILTETPKVFVEKAEQTEIEMVTKMVTSGSDEEVF